MKLTLTQIIKMLLPFIVGSILTVAIIVFVLLQLSAASYLVLLVCINAIVLWLWIMSNNDLLKSNRRWDTNTNEFFDRMADAESDIRDIKEHLKLNEQ